MQRQLEFWDEETGQPQPVAEFVVSDKTRELRQSIQTLASNASEYISLKRVSLVYEGSFEGRSKLTSTQDAKVFFDKYWHDNPAHDQEKFVVACLDTKHRVQCVVLITVGTLDASLVHPREVFKPAILEGSRAFYKSLCAYPQ